MKPSLPLIFVHYTDIGESGPRQGCGFFSLHRQVTTIQTVQGGRAGTIRYKRRSVPVYQSSGSSSWDTSRSVLGPITITYLH